MNIMLDKHLNNLFFNSIIFDMYRVHRIARCCSVIVLLQIKDANGSTTRPTAWSLSRNTTQDATILS